MRRADTLAQIQREVVECERCPRLVTHRRKMARVKRRAYRNWEYWGRPVPSFGDPQARLLLIGLAPGAHGANRTGRMFTGDDSGNFLFRVLYKTGFASQPEAVDRADGLQLTDCYITAAVRCAPPHNKPSREEFAACRRYLERELQRLRRVRVVVPLGRLALDSYLSALLSKEQIERRAAYPFEHGKRYDLPGNLPILLCCYHPSRQNTQTGRLTEAMMVRIFRRARWLLS